MFQVVFQAQKGADAAQVVRGQPRLIGYSRVGGVDDLLIPQVTNQRQECAEALIGHERADVRVPGNSVYLVFIDTHFFLLFSSHADRSDTSNTSRQCALLASTV